MTKNKLQIKQSKTWRRTNASREKMPLKMAIRVAFDSMSIVSQCSAEVSQDHSKDPKTKRLKKKKKFQEKFINITVLIINAMVPVTVSSQFLQTENVYVFLPSRIWKRSRQWWHLTWQYELSRVIATRVSISSLSAHSIWNNFQIYHLLWLMKYTPGFKTPLCCVHLVCWLSIPSATCVRKSWTFMDRKNCKL